VAGTHALAQPRYGRRISQKFAEAHGSSLPTPDRQASARLLKVARYAYSGIVRIHLNLQQREAHGARYFH
jgi:hypothetical protein